MRCSGGAFAALALLLAHGGLLAPEVCAQRLTPRRAYSANALIAPPTSAGAPEAAVKVAVPETTWTRWLATHTAGSPLAAYDQARPREASRVSPQALDGLLKANIDPALLDLPADISAREVYAAMSHVTSGNLAAAGAKLTNREFYTRNKQMRADMAGLLRRAQPDELVVLSLGVFHGHDLFLHLPAKERKKLNFAYYSPSEARGSQRFRDALEKAGPEPQRVWKNHHAPTGCDLDMFALVSAVHQAHQEGVLTGWTPEAFRLAQPNANPRGIVFLEAHYVDSTEHIDRLPDAAGLLASGHRSITLGIESIGRGKRVSVAEAQQIIFEKSTKPFLDEVGQQRKNLLATLDSETDTQSRGRVEQRVQQLDEIATMRDDATLVLFPVAAALLKKLAEYERAGIKVWVVGLG